MAETKKLDIDSVITDLSHIEGDISINHQLAKHTTWKVGGSAKIYYQPKNRLDLQHFLKALQNRLTIVWLGLGSNVLIRDGGIDGVVINPLKYLNAIELPENNEEPDSTVAVEVGATCGKFSRTMADNGLHGAEFLSGIPGTMGGAIAMNAGAFGGECWDTLSHVETIDEKGTIRTREPGDYLVSYRRVELKPELALPSSAKEFFIKGFFRYRKNFTEVKKAKQKIRELLGKRNDTQPINTANAGSVFKNPPGDYAARLIEACGLKNTRVGDAWVSEKHANFIINKGDAKASDIEALIALVQETVNKRYAIRLEPEVKIIGDK